MLAVYSPDKDIGGQAWAERKDGLVYRACCNPTFDTRSSNPDVYVYPRAGICAATRGKPAFDVSISLCGLAHWCQKGVFQELCDGCM
jgi:hypothetical protein